MKKLYKLIYYATIILFCSLVPTINSFSQDLEIYYNSMDESMTFVYEGETIQRPKVKKFSNIILHVENLNNYLYEVTLDITNEVVNYSSGNYGSNPASLINDEYKNTSSGSGSPLLYTPGSYGALNEASEQLDDIEFDVAFGFAGEEETAEEQLTILKDKLVEELEKLKAIETKIQAEEEKVENILHREKVLQIAPSTIEQIKQNPTIPPARIKELVEEYLQKIFNKSTAELSVDDLIKMSQPKAELELAIGLLNDRLKDYSASINTIEGLSTLVKQLEIEDEEYQKMNDILGDLSNRVRNYEDNMYANTRKLEEIQEELSTPDFQSLANLRVTAEEILNNTFTQTFRITAVKDLTHIRINKFSKLGPNVGGGYDSHNQQPTITIPTVGGLKTMASVGFSFSQFFDKEQRFSTKNDKIITEEADNFQPIITSYFHFFPHTTGNFTLGGSFGIGLPILGQDRNASANFSLGVSLLFGKAEKLVLTGGLMGGRKAVLGKDYQVGDEFFERDTPLPLDYPYDMGFFVGISFNLLSN